MDTSTAQPVSTFQPQAPSMQNPPAQDSYADAYVPPSNQQAAIDPAMVDQPLPVAQPVAPSAEPVMPVTEEPLLQEQMPPAVEQPPSTEAPSNDAPSQDLADQNIFEMLGVTTGTPEQREQFLDELQQVIWEDFIEHDTKLLLTESEQAELRTILQASPDKSLEQQEQVVVFLEKLIPDLEDIMLEKALQLKEEMARERLKALRELHRNDTNQLATIERAEQLMGQAQWRSASEALNSVT